MPIVYPDHFLEDVPVLDAVEETTIICVASGPDYLSYQLAVSVLFTDPVLLGNPTAPTPDPDDSSTRVATTEFVQDLISASNADLSESGSLAYTNAAPSTITVGGIPAGSTFDGQTLTQLFDSLLYPYQSPAFTSFSLAGPNPVEVGVTISGNQTFNWSTSQSANVQPNSISLLDITGSVTLVTGLANSGSHVVTLPSSVRLNSAGSYTWGIRGTNTQSGTFTGNYAVTWEWLVAYGESSSTTLTASAIQALRVTGLRSGFTGSYSFSGGGYNYLCWPIVYGYPTSFKDAATGFVMAMATPAEDASYNSLNNGYYSALVSVTNSYGVVTNYAVYRTQSILNGSITIQVN
jgi:hypothetical protein